jgi:hypothetical protein
MRKCNTLIILSLVFVLLVSGKVFSGPTPIESLVPKVVPEGWTLRDAPETFTKETLFEHIDGQADLFLQYGFEKSVLAIYRNMNSADDKIDVDIYDMGNPTQAFGVFSRFRQKESPAGFGLDSYLGERYALFYKGRYFVVLQATEADPSILKQLAKSIDAEILDTSPPPKEIQYFPKTGLKPGSIEYFPDGLLGHEFLKRGFKGTYLEKDQTSAKVETGADDNESYLFIAIFENSSEASSALKLFKEDLAKRGRVEAGAQTKFGPDALMGEDPYQGRMIVLHKGPSLIGATGFKNSEYGEARLAEFINQVK